jgi:hypothetical protein
LAKKDEKIALAISVWIINFQFSCLRTRQRILKLLTLYSQRRADYVNTHTYQVLLKMFEFEVLEFNSNLAKSIVFFMQDLKNNWMDNFSKAERERLNEYILQASIKMGEKKKETAKFTRESLADIEKAVHEEGAFFTESGVDNFLGANIFKYLLNNIKS